MEADLVSCGNANRDIRQAVKCGLVTKILNVTRGRPALTFMKVKDIYEAADAKNHDLLPTLHPKDEFEILSFQSDRIEVKSPCLHMADRRTIKREPETSDLFCNDFDKRIDSDSDDLELDSMSLKQITERCNAKKRKRSKCVESSKETGETSNLFCNDFDKRIDSDSDDLELDSMTLKQITERCNAKKRKRSKCVESSNRTGETSSCLKPDFSNFRKEEEDLDLKEPLCSWKSKHSKNMKVNKKRMKNHVSTSSQSSKSIVKSEQVSSDEVLPQSSGDLPAINIKETTETSSCPTPCYFNFQKQEEDLDMKEPLRSWKSKHSKNMKVKKKRMKNHVSTSSQSSKLIVKSEQVPSDEVLPQYSGDLPAVNIKVEVPEPECSDRQNVMCVGGDTSLLYDEPVASCGMVFSKLCETANESVSETQVSISLTEEPQYCVTNEVGYDYMELTDPKSVQILRTSGRDSMKVDSTETISHDFADMPVLESEIKVYIHPVLDEISPETIYSATGHSSYISGISQSASPMTIHKSPQSIELCHRGDAYVFEDGIAAELPSNPKVSVIASSTSNCSRLDSVEDDSSTEELKQPQSSFPMIIHESPQGMELGHGGDAYVFEDGIADEDVLYNPKGSVIASTTSNCSCLDSVDDDSPRAEVKQPQSNSPMTIHESTQGVELGHGSDAYVFGDGIAAELTSNPEVGVIASSTSNCSCLDSVEDDSPRAEVKQPQSNSSMTIHESPRGVEDAYVFGDGIAAELTSNPKVGVIASSTSNCSCLDSVEDDSPRAEVKQPQSNSPMTIHESPQGVEDAYVFGDGIAAELTSNPEVGVIACSTSNCSCLDSVEDDSPRAEVKQPQSNSPMTIHESPQGVELGHGGDAYVFGDGIAELISNPEVGVIARFTSDCSLSPDSCLNSLEDDSPTAEVKQLQKSACANADINVSAGIHSFDATDELMTSVGFGYCNHSKLQHPPAKLFPTRKAISPTSQERLLKTMDSDKFTDSEYDKCRGEFYFGMNKFGRVEGPDQIREAELSINPQQTTRKQKINKRGFPPKAVHKVPHLSCAVPRFSTGCTSIQSCTQGAIEFSQQQMKDFECLAMKLTKELQSMKDILEERLLPEACPALSLKYNVDRARTAINNATRVEESTRRRLSMMARDCKRFCTIMGLTEKDSGPSGNVVHKESKKSTFSDEASGISVDQLKGLAETGPASGNVVHKERKKITFADEAGGKLCHVRVFEDDVASLLESNNEKQELLVN